MTDMPTKMPSTEKSELTLWKRLGQNLRVRLNDLNIRMKIISPYLLLTLGVAIIGIYVVTSLVFRSVDERLTNHTLQAGRVVSNQLARLEIQQQEAARTIGYTEGFAALLAAQDKLAATEMARSVGANSNLELLLVVNAAGDVIVHLQRQEGQLESVAEPIEARSVAIIQDLLGATAPKYKVKRTLGRYPVNDQYYYFTALTIIPEDELAGVVMVGTPLETLLPQLKKNSLADITFYISGGQAIASTFTTAFPASETAAMLNTLALDPAEYTRRSQSATLTATRRDTIAGQEYEIATGALYVGNDSLGVFSVALDTDFVMTAGQASRDSYFLIFTVATLGVITLGYIIAHFITSPIRKLAQTSQAVADGNLNRRSEIVSNDEIGVLARTFDFMTATLAQRNAELQETASRMQAILSSIGDGVLVEDINGDIKPANVAAEQMLKELSANFGRGPLRELSGGQELVTDLQANSWILESRRIQVANKVFSAHSAEVRTEMNEKLGTVVVLRDVTAEVEAEQLKDAFVEHVSHELRTPLTSIKGYSSLLLTTTKTTLSEQQLAFLQTIIQQTDNLTTMVNALLDFSEMQASGRLGLRTQRITMTEIVRNLEKDWREPLEEKGLHFTVEIAPNIPDIQGDSRRLHWALMNLIRNAYQYTPAGGTVKVHLGLHERHIQIAVSDTGIGITPDNQRRIFNRFHRVMNVKDDESRGLGLGLYVSKAIVEAHKGAITVTSQVGQGSTFTIQLPLGADAGAD
ncbi:MAG TPA: ATP-binding protein [Anaerolineae bacterium]|nr:ATP-binding protein [Anaerolineae bacterium]